MTERLRGRAGQAQRLRRLQRTSGLCEACADEGRTTIATAVDHIVPLAQRGEDVDSNTRNLCDPHHRAVTAEQFGLARSTGMAGSDLRGMPTDPTHPWNRLSRT